MYVTVLVSDRTSVSREWDPTAEMPSEMKTVRHGLGIPMRASKSPTLAKQLIWLVPLIRAFIDLLADPVPGGYPGR